MIVSRLRFAFFLGGLIICAIYIGWRPDASPRTAVFSIALPPGGGALPAAIRTDLKAGTPAAHAATLARLPNGELVTLWFAGSREGARDVRIYLARWHGGRWSDAEAVLAVGGVMVDEWRFVRKLGNPVSVVDADGRLHVFFVSVSVGGWATSNINQVTSEDGGRTWGRARVLVTSPFLNLSTLSRTVAVMHADGGFDLPVYHEGARKFPELLRFDKHGRNFQKIRISTANDLIQPAIVALGERDGIALLRDSGPGRRLRATLTADGGASWSSIKDTDQINPDSSIALGRLSDGTLLLAYNPRPDGRSELALATSADGLRWTSRRSVEYEGGGEFSYPTLLVAADDEIHLVYTWQRRHIRHVLFNRAWLMATVAPESIR